ncbi:MAG: hypothetical protein JW727_04275 [Candidatus Aenigmarchaeota archaeon]|nr:hypothetical protein [Candidatus Aenigmarchaeota archaeon]
MGAIGRTSRGNINLDFAVGISLFMLAFFSSFAYLNQEYMERLSNERQMQADSELENALAAVPKALFEKRVILVEGYSENELVVLPGYGADLVLDSSGKPVCYDERLEGFVANISGRAEFYAYLTSDYFVHDFCTAGPFYNRLEEKISSPIYLEALTSVPRFEGRGETCSRRVVSVLTSDGFEEAVAEFCI